MIGVFDSGLGGLTVVKQIFRQLPGRGVVYFGDTARVPYGSKSPELITQHSRENVQFLLEQGATVIMVACNSASAHAVAALRKEFSVPIFEVVSPAVKKAVKVTEGRLGVIGTTVTVASGEYKKQVKAMHSDVQIFSEACPLFVPLVEEGWVQRKETEMIAEKYLAPLKKKNIDTLILGCTHYPFLRPIIKRVVGDVRLIDPAHEAVIELSNFLSENRSHDAILKRKKSHRFYVSDRVRRSEEMASKWLGMPIKLRKV